jgi:hypothetical protein
MAEARGLRAEDFGQRGKADGVTKLHGGSPLTRPDALRSLGERSFLLIEGSGTLDRVSITGDAFAVAPIRGGFREPTSVTRVESHPAPGFPG